MQKNGAKLTVFFEEPFWVGLYQRWSGPKLEVAKITFGAEPKDGECTSSCWSIGSGSPSAPLWSRKSRRNAA